MQTILRVMQPCYMFVFVLKSVQDVTPIIVSIGGGYEFFSAVSLSFFSVLNDF